jgi:hypothetical protein
VKRKIRAAWGLSGLLALGLVGGLSAFARYGQQMDATVHWLPFSYWWVGKSSNVLTGLVPAKAVEKPFGELYGLGFVQVYLPHHGPEVVYRYTFPKAPGNLGHHKYPGTQPTARLKD